MKHLLFILSFALLFASCKENPIEPTPSKPYNRTYIFSFDTIQNGLYAKCKSVSSFDSSRIKFDHDAYIDTITYKTSALGTFKNVNHYFVPNGSSFALKIVYEQGYAFIRVLINGELQGTSSGCNIANWSGDAIVTTTICPLE